MTECVNKPKQRPASDNPLLSKGDLCARLIAAAYGYISAADQRVRDEDSYVQGQGEFTGFTARLAGKLADFMDLNLID